jgi:hypothetical protein
MKLKYIVRSSVKILKYFAAIGVVIVAILGGHAIAQEIDQKTPAKKSLGYEDSQFHSMLAADLIALGFTVGINNAVKGRMSERFLDEDAYRSLKTSTGVSMADIDELRSEMRKIDTWISKLKQSPSSETLNRGLSDAVNLVKNRAAKITDKSSELHRIAALLDPSDSSFKTSLGKLETILYDEEFNWGNQFRKLSDNKLRGHKGLKALKAVTIVGGIVFAVDLGGQIWKFSTDQPVPFRFPGVLGVEILKKSPEAIAAAVKEAVIDKKDLKDIENKNGTDKDFQEDGPTSTPKKH